MTPDTPEQIAGPGGGSVESFADLPPPLAHPGTTCWKITRADRFRFLVDGAAYFAALRQVLIAAREQVLISAWDISSTIPLVDPEAPPPDDGWPVRLAELLRALTEARPALHVRVLLWDFPVLYASDRELLPAWRQNWNPNPRMTLRLDGTGPVEGAHHEKVVVIDDRLAFMGGLDLAPARWDTSSHYMDDTRRRLPTSGEPYPAFHDMQAMMEGPVAGELGAMLRARWARVTGEAEPPKPTPFLPSAWPEGWAPDIDALPLALARTAPGDEMTAPVSEIAALIEADIRAARHWIYMEDQYLTSRLVADLLAERLAEPDGPEVVAVIPRIWDGWLETATMGVGRERLLRVLKNADHYGRLRVVTPVLEGRGPGKLKIHTKLMIVDDIALRHGSANLNNRSMGLDTELDYHLEPGLVDPVTGTARGDDVRHLIAFILCTLLGEHLAATPDQVRATLHETGSLRSVLDRYGDPAVRDLEPVESGDAPDDLVESMPSPVPGDFEAPVDAKDLRAVFLPDLGDIAESKGARHPYRRILILAGLGLALLIAWRFVPLDGPLTVERAAAWIEGVRGHPLAPLGGIGFVALGSLVMAPILPLMIANALVFGPIEGMIYNTIGTLITAAIGFGLGRLLAKNGLDTLTEKFPKARTLVEAVRNHALKTVIFFRVVPVLLFMVVNLACGAAGITWRTYLLGTLIGQLPGIAVLSLFGAGLGQLIQAASWTEVLLILLGLAALVLGFRWFSRVAARGRPKALDDEGGAGA
ncbi:hypothetical protein F1188_00770 [Roseospira marina]|uniref:PLD phosphodiesterase domain-containing protein n=1 Tax=Roseospira marina TaxID=140057 RepID=A0A5M6IGH9_9PROT|nr:VTT domain-containing protein [Roseospira marina]KAA5607334.1 hypothetical protein F1188_00770 [Roseospira marina]MBB4312503.1 phosphatidylserine/phosphatidylglycerophosphate/cardiolipin synthase-like enzyme/uncharacterized membrane protein YdjX (TVP38/TMEM64 family) [Roseospira marina]MBB5085481.1 phosphatidylserine/phosphatidylglycerophosphate/cardiolipin synthase-like enzyme/uncharacterized membrane protein YdjX (TVP38/TMEM64 family) [Roseospira marina]